MRILPDHFTGTIFAALPVRIPGVVLTDRLTKGILDTLPLIIIPGADFP